MKVAITGGTGFLGRPIAEALRREGHELVILTRRPETASPGEGVERAFFDPLQPFPAENLRGADAVIHLAGERVDQRWTATARDLILRSRVEGTRSIVAAARAAGSVKVLLSASGVSYYGDAGAQAVNESSPSGEGFLASVTRAWEAAAMPAADAGIRTVRLRIGVVLHPDGGALARLLLPFKLGLGGPIGSGEQYMSWIHRDDLVALVSHVLKTGALQGAVNATAPFPATNREFVRALGRALHRPTLIPLPGIALRGAFGEMSSTILEGQRALPRRALESGFTFRFPEIEGALRNLLGGEARAA